MKNNSLVKNLDRPSQIRNSFNLKYPQKYENIFHSLFFKIFIIFPSLITHINSLPDNFHVSFTGNSIFSKNFEKITTLNFRYESANSNTTINAQTINKDDSAIFKIEKSNAEILTSVSNMYKVNNDDSIISNNEYIVEYIYPNSSILSQFQNPLINKTNSEKTIKCNYFVNSANITYNKINVKSYKATAKYSFLTFVLKQNVNGLFYLEYNSNNNELNEVNVNSNNYDLNSEKFINLWFIEQKFIDNDFIILAKENESDFDLIIFKIRLNDLLEKNLNFDINFYTKIQIKSNLYWQLNKIGYYKDQFIIATKNNGLVVLHKFARQSFNNNTFSNLINYDNYLMNNDSVWTIKTTINNFSFPRRSVQSVNIKEEIFSIKINNPTNQEKFSNLDFNHKRYLQNNTTLNMSLNTHNTSNNTDINKTEVVLNTYPYDVPNVQKTGDISIINTNIRDIIINEFSIYLIVENRGLFIINLENLQISEDFFYENSHLYKLEVYCNIFLGNKFIGVYAENPESSSQELFFELLIDGEFNPLANKVFTSPIYTGKGKAATYDDFFTFILNTKEKKLILIRKGMFNYIPFITQILDISNYIKFDLENTDFISLYDSFNKKIIYSLYSLNLIIPLHITFADEFVNCKFSQSGKYDMNFIQRSELCLESINSNRALSFCERKMKYSIEVVGPASKNVQNILTGVLITFSIILIGLIIFFILKTDGCKSLKYFKIIKSAQIRERLYYDAGQDINIEGHKQREILSERIILNNQTTIKKVKETDKLKDTKKENINMLQNERNFKFIFNPEIKNNELDPQQVRKSLVVNEEEYKLKIENKNKIALKFFKEDSNEDIKDLCKSKNVFNFNEIINKKYSKNKHGDDTLEGKSYQNYQDKNEKLESKQNLEFDKIEEKNI